MINHDYGHSVQFMILRFHVVILVQFLHTFSRVLSVSYYIVKGESRTLWNVFVIDEWTCLQFMCHFVLLGKNVALLLPLENFQIISKPCATCSLYPQIIEGLGFYIIYIVYQVGRIKNINILLNQIETIESDRQKSNLNRTTRNMNCYTPMANWDYIQVLEEKQFC